MLYQLHKQQMTLLMKFQ